MARQAMVKIMLADKNQQRHHRDGAEAGNHQRGRRKWAPQQGKERGRASELTCQDRVGNSSRCILWCAIALGALLKGSPLSFVAGYVKLAQDSLSECFDGTTVETARAYLAMAFVCRFLGDQEKNEEYISFASSIVDGLPAELVPSDMDNMLLVWVEEYKVINYSSGGPGVPVKHTEKGEGVNQTPVVKGVVNERDLCNIILLADRHMHRYIWQGMKVEGTPTNIRTVGQEGEEGRALDEGVGRAPGTFQENIEWGEVGEVTEGATGGPKATLQSSFRTDVGVGNRGCGVTLPNRVSTEMLIAEVLPELERISRVIESVIAYTNIVKGERRTAFQSIRVCTRVMTEFPGICRYRPHMVHCVMLALASTMCPVMYDPMRELYNSILPENGNPAPPLEEWGGMSSICNTVFCRSFEVSTNYVGFGPTNVKFGHGRAAPWTPPQAPLFGLNAPSVTEGTHGSSICLACGEHGSPWPASPAGTGVMQTPHFDNDVHGTSPTHAQPCYSQHTVEVASGGGHQPEATARVVPPDSSVSEEFYRGDGRHCDTGAVSTGCRVSAQYLERRSEVVDVDLLGGFVAEGTPKIQRRTDDVPAGTVDLGVVLISDSVSCDGGVENIDVSFRADDVGDANDLTGCELNMFGEERDGDDLCLSEDYLMDAVEALMTSAPIDGEIEEEIVGSI